MRGDGGGGEKRGKKGEKQIITVLCCKYLQDNVLYFLNVLLSFKDIFFSFVDFDQPLTIRPMTNFNSFPSIHFHISI